MYLELKCGKEKLTAGHTRDNFVQLCYEVAMST